MPHIHLESALGSQQSKKDRGRRSESRHRTVYRPCSIKLAEREVLGLIRNISETGAQIECSIDVIEGDIIRYSDGNCEPISARVAWSDQGRFGVQNLCASRRRPSRFNARAVRVGCELPCKIWKENQTWECIASNISQTGALVRGLREESAGAPITIQIGELMIYNAQVRWAKDDRAGVQFPEAMPMRSIVRLLEAA